MAEEMGMSYGMVFKKKGGKVWCCAAFVIGFGGVWTSSAPSPLSIERSLEAESRNGVLRNPWGFRCRSKYGEHSFGSGCFSKTLLGLING